MPNAKAGCAISSDRHLAATIGKNTIFGIVASGVQVGTRLITIPLVIHYLGLGGFGIWSIIMVTAAYMRFGSAGIKSAFQKYVAEATQTGDFETANTLVSTGSLTMLLISALCLLPAALLSQTIAKLSGVPPGFVSAVSLSIAVLALTYAISNFGAAFEAIVMGGHRIDLTSKYDSILMLCEALAITALLRAGHGLLGMTIVMAVSELIYIALCYRASLRVVPEMQVGFAHFKINAYPELIRFAGSFQLLNMLELLYGAVVPIVLLKWFGADAAGVAALAGRLTNTALIAQSALVLPILSGASVIFASRSVERIRLFLAKSFKVTLAAAVPPLAFICAFGATMLYIWTGLRGPQFRVAIWLVSLAALLNAVSMLQLILYRASGRALLDNIRQVLRIIAILVVAMVARRIGFYGVLAGTAVAELVGVIFMFCAMASTFQSFSIRALVEDALRIGAATALLIGAGAVAGMVSIPLSAPERIVAAIKLGEIVCGSLMMVWPALILTQAVSGTERRSLLDAILPGRRKLVQASQ